MLRLSSRAFVWGAFLACPLAVFGQGNSAEVSRGRYLVNQVAKCGDCHTPKLPTGAPDMSKFLKGTVLPFQPTHPVPGWANASPDLTSTSPLWKGWDEKGMVAFFTTGHTPSGKEPAPPMPSYTLTKQDATAIAAYLHSLK
jgi:mono/diheme cytochrome c family protein